jgi:hypothetical protein
MTERWETSGRTDEGEFREIHLDRSRTRARTDHDIDLIVFHRRVEDFFYHRLESVDFIDKEYIAGLETREHGEHICWLINSRSWSMTETCASFCCDEHRERRLSESWRPIEEDMFDIGISDFCWIQSDLEVFFYHRLPDIIREFFLDAETLPHYLQWVVTGSMRRLWMSFEVSLIAMAIF